MHDIIDAESIFIKTLESLMNDYRINYDTCSKEYVDATIRLCTAEFYPIWNEFVMFAAYGDDKKLNTRILLKQIIKNKIYKIGK